MKFFYLLWVCALSLHGYAIDREAFSITNYNLDIRIEPEQQRLAARGKIILRNRSKSPQKNLSLQISSTLHWRSIQVDGRAVQFVSQPLTSDIDHTGALSEAIVTFPGEIAPQATVELAIGYEGLVALDATRLTRIGVPADVARHSDWDQINKSGTAVRGVGYVAWYPIATEAANLSEGNSMFETIARWKAREADAQLRVKFEHSGEGTPATLACNGEPGGLRSSQGTESSDEGVTECAFQPLGDAVPLFAIGKYEAIDRPAIAISYTPDHKPAAERYAIAAQLALPFVTEWFGSPKGRSEVKAEVIELGDPEAAPYESGSMLLTPLNADSKMAQLSVVHELTHAAFFSPQPWIYEGLAHFARAGFREGEGGREAALDFMDVHRRAVAEAEKAAAARPADGAPDSLIATSVEEFYRSKAMYVWWMLRDMIGDSKLKQTLEAYHAEDDRKPAYMQHLLESETKRDLQWFFDDWVYRDRGLPDFRVVSAHPRKMMGNSYIVTVTLENRGDAGAEVPVTLKMVDGQVIKRLEVRGKSEATIRIETTSTPLELVVNDGSVPESDRNNNVYQIELPEKGS